MMVNYAFMKYIRNKIILKNILVNRIFTVNVIFMINDLFTKYIYDKKNL